MKRRALILAIALTAGTSIAWAEASSGTVSKLDGLLLAQTSSPTATGPVGETDSPSSVSSSASEAPSGMMGRGRPMGLTPGDQKSGMMGHGAMMHGAHGMGKEHGAKHGGKGHGKGHGKGMHGGEEEMHHRDVLARLKRIEKRQIIIEAMLRELLLSED